MVHTRRAWVTVTRLLQPAGLVALAGILSSCSVLIGNVKPVETKSDRYQFLDLSRESGDWERVKSEDTAASSDVQQPETETSDVTFQSKSSASVIALNSSCRTRKQQSEGLPELTRRLLLGITGVDNTKGRVSLETQVDGNPAYQTTVSGEMNDEPVTVRAIVTRRAECVYDLIYIARPEKFSQKEADFSRFVSSLRLR